MKSLFIVASLLTNGALLALLFARPNLAPHSVYEFLSRSNDQPPAQRTAKLPKAVNPRQASLWSIVYSQDPKVFVERLLAAGFSAPMIRALVASEINASYEERFRALQDPEPDAPFWKIRPTFFTMGDKRLEEMTQLQRERARVLRELFSDEFFASDDVTAAQRRQFGDLSRSKVDALQRIEDDYSEMNAAVRSGTGGILLAQDRETLALLAREKRADLAAILSPAELADYEMRSSPTTNMLRTRLGGFEPNESEFRAIFQAQQALNEKFPGHFSSIDHQTRLAAQRDFQDQLRSMLGDARYADFARETNNDFVQLSRIIQRENLPRESALQAYNLRESTAVESNRIFDDSGMSVDDKRAALQTLAQSARIKLLATLGPAAGPEYVKMSETWLGNIERGSAVSFSRSTMFVIVSDQGMFSSGGSPEYRRLPINPTPPRP